MMVTAAFPHLVTKALTKVKHFPSKWDLVALKRFANNHLWRRFARTFGKQKYVRAIFWSQNT